MKLHVLALSLLLVPAAHAGQIELVSAAGTESETAEGSYWHTERPVLSADGRWIAFSSDANNLVPGQQDRNRWYDVFLHDRQTGATTLVSHAPGLPATASEHGTYNPSMSADGRFVVYAGYTDAGDGTAQLYLYDRDAGTTTLVSHAAAGPAVPASAGAEVWAEISADGSWIAFTSTSHDLVPGQTEPWPGKGDLFLYERATGQITLVSRAAGTAATTANNESFGPSLSADGRYLAFDSWATNLISGFSNASGGSSNVFLYDRVAGTTTLVSRKSGMPLTGAGGRSAALSPEGGAVAFVSDGTGLVAGQTGVFVTNVFLFDRASGANVLVSHAPGSSTTPGNDNASTADPRIGAGGAWVAFAWSATNGVAGQVDANGYEDVFLFERATGTITLVSHTSASPTSVGNFGSTEIRMSADGRFVVFESRATDLVAGQSDANQETDVFLFDRTAGTVSLLSGAGGSAQTTGNAKSVYPDLSADGSQILFQTYADDLVPGAADLNSGSDVVVHDRETATSELMTVHAPGMASATAGIGSFLAGASADRRYVVFLSEAENVVPGQVDGNRSRDVFLADRATGASILVSRAASSPVTTGNGEAIHAAISADGAWVVFTSRATDLVPGQTDTNVEWDFKPGADVFLFDRAAGTTTLLSHAAGSASTTGDGPCTYIEPGLAISADGRFTAFSCTASNLVAGQVDAAGPSRDEDVFLYDRVSGQTSIVSRIPGSDTTTGNGGSWFPALSADGRYIAFLSRAIDLVSGGVAGSGGSGTANAYLRDTVSGQTFLVSRAAGTAATGSSGDSRTVAINGAGRYVAFVSSATDLVPGQTEPPQTYALGDVFLFDRQTGIVELISRSNGSATNTADHESIHPALSEDGRYVAFMSRARDLVTGQVDTTGSWDVFVHDRVLRTMELASRSGSSTRALGDFSGRPSLSPDGRYVAFHGGSGFTGTLHTLLFDRSLQVLERIAGGYEVTYSVLGQPMPLVTPDGGEVVFMSSDPDLVAADYNAENDVFAYVRTAPAGGDFYTLTPCRLLDTLSGAAPVSGELYVLDVHGACGVPETATAVALNVTVAQPTGQGRLSLQPGNVLATGTSTVNFPANRTLANNAILSLATNGEGTLAFSPFVIGGGTVHVIVDLTGYFQ